jgi:imidazolonepropionase-like amidohydrolase
MCFELRTPRGRPFLPALHVLAAVFCVSADAAEPVTVLRAARLYDGKSEAVVAPGIVVANGSIVAAGPRAEVPGGARWSISAMPRLPGLMDAHTHVTFESSLDWKQDQLDFLKKPIPELAIDATEYARRTLLAGFTTVRDVGSTDLLDVGLRNAINAGKVPGPRMLVAVNPIGARGGHCDPTGGFRPETLKEPGPEQGGHRPDEIRAAVRFDTKHGADVIKTCATGGCSRRRTRSIHRSSPRPSWTRWSTRLTRSAVRPRRTPMAPRGPSGRSALASTRSSTARSSTTRHSS